MQIRDLDAIENRTIGGVIRRQLGERPDQTAVMSRMGTLTYRELYENGLSIGGGLQRMGVEQGTPVLLMLDNHLEYVTSWIGVGLIGAVEVPVNTAYRGTILAHVVNDSGARLVVVEKAFLDTLIAVREQLTHIDHVVVHGSTGALPTVDGWTVVAFEDLRDGAPAEPADLHAWDLMGIMYTSGTTGNSKGVLATHGLGYSYSSAHWIEPGEVIMCNLPLFHVGGQWAGVYAALIAGGTSAVVPRFSASTFWDDVRYFGCTQTLLLGAMASFLSAQPALDRDRDHPMRHINMVPLVPDYKEFSERFDTLLGAAYGLTEFSSPILVPYGLAEPGLTGWPREDYEVRLVDDNDMDVVPGATGELVLRPKVPWAMMAGYHGLPDKTAEAWRNLWFHTGDAMSQDEQGRYHFVDRRNDALRVRGENVSSFEVENEVVTHPAVLSCAVVAVPSQHTEDEIKAVVVFKDGMSAAPEELLKHLVPRLPYFMVPRYFEFLVEMPTTPTQKVKKAELRQLGVTSATWDREQAGYKLTKAGLQEPTPTHASNS